jgi:hypothetical protein
MKSELEKMNKVFQEMEQKRDRMYEGILKKLTVLTDKQQGN